MTRKASSFSRMRTRASLFFEFMYRLKSKGVPSGASGKRRAASGSVVSGLAAPKDEERSRGDRRGFESLSASSASPREPVLTRYGDQLRHLLLDEPLAPLATTRSPISARSGLVGPALRFGAAGQLFRFWECRDAGSDGFDDEVDVEGLMDRAGHQIGRERAQLEARGNDEDERAECSGARGQVVEDFPAVHPRHHEVEQDDGVVAASEPI